MLFLKQSRNWRARLSSSCSNNERGLSFFSYTLLLVQVVVVVMKFSRVNKNCSGDVDAGDRNRVLSDGGIPEIPLCVVVTLLIPVVPKDRLFWRYKLFFSFLIRLVSSCRRRVIRIRLSADSRCRDVRRTACSGSCDDDDIMNTFDHDFFFFFNHASLMQVRPLSLSLSAPCVNGSCVPRMCLP